MTVKKWVDFRSLSLSLSCEDSLVAKVVKMYELPILVDVIWKRIQKKRTCAEMAFIYIFACYTREM